VNGPVAWFARNSVAANLLMITILAFGFFTISDLTLEVFPEFSSDRITVRVPYLGAAPEEVEKGVCVRIEEEIRGLEGIKRVTSTASEGMGTVSIELMPGEDARKVLDDVKARVDAITTFPEETEKPIISEMIIRNQVINVALSGNASEATLKHLGERARDEIADLPGITQVELTNARPYEISIEVSETSLLRYGLTFEEVARAVRANSLDLPGGSVKTSGGEILIRTKGQAYRRPEFESIALRTRPDGTRLILSDVARVIDGFAETDQFARFDRQPTVLIQVFRVGQQNAVEIADAVKAYVAEAQGRLPEGVALTIWADFSRVLRDRLGLLARNGVVGFFLVVLILSLFLKLRLAFWVSLGIPISFLGAIWLMPGMDASINLISLFAFIVVLGIVVDDAIIVGENIYRHMQEGKEGVEAATIGAAEVITPVTFAVLTSIAAFSPLLAVPGNTGKIMKLIPEVVIATLIFSLIESIFILPSHLAHARIGRDDATPGRKGWWSRVQDTFAGGLKRLIDNVYTPLLERALQWRYVTISIALSTLILTLGVVGGGWIKFVFFPNIDADNVVALLTMPQGTPVEVTADAIRRLESSALELQDEVERKTGQKMFRHVLTSIGEQPFSARQNRFNSGGAVISTPHVGEVNIELVPSEERPLSSSEIGRRWRELTGPIPDATRLSFTTSLFSAGDAVNVQLAGPNYVELQNVAELLKTRLAEYPGVTDIADTFVPGKQEVQLELTDAGRSLGLTLSDLGRQIRQAFYGEEAQRIQRGRDDIRVMVRYPESERRSLGNLEDMRVRTPSGGEIPFALAAEGSLGRGYAAIQRADRKRIVNVTADVDKALANANEVLANLTANVLPGILADHPSVTYTLEGEQREQADTMGGLLQGFLFAILAIYILLAIPFKSYVQPLIVMSAIPFGIVGAVWGHLIMGLDLTMLSIFGIVALTGVVVNDSLVMVDFINRANGDKIPTRDAIRQAGKARFRPILLTSITTFGGLTPLLLERSLQAQFLIPMAVSLGFGVVFATAVTLILVPSLYQILEDSLAWLAGFRQRLGTFLSPEAEASAD